jgi:YD repeat-containing protein
MGQRGGLWLNPAEAQMTYTHNGPVETPTDERGKRTFYLLGRLTEARDGNGHFVRRGYDALGRQVSEASLNGGEKRMEYDLAGRRTRLAWPDGFAVTYDYLVTGEMTHIRENGAQSGLGVLATFGYDDRGRRTSLTRGNGSVTTYGYNHPSGLPSHLGHHVPRPGQPSFDPFSYFSHNAAGQVINVNRNHDAFAATPANQSLSTPADGLNRIGQAGAAHQLPVAGDRDPGSAGPRAALAM